MKGAQTRSAPGKEWLADEHNGPSGPNQDPVFPKSLLNPSQGAKDGTFKALRMVMEKVWRTSLARGNNYYSVKAGVFPRNAHRVSAHDLTSFDTCPSPPHHSCFSQVSPIKGIFVLSLFCHLLISLHLFSSEGVCFLSLTGKFKAGKV